MIERGVAAIHLWCLAVAGSVVDAEESNLDVLAYRAIQ